jgi:hypothetical protein
MQSLHPFSGSIQEICSEFLIPHVITLTVVRSARRKAKRGTIPAFRVGRAN